MSLLTNSAHPLLVSLASLGSGATLLIPTLTGHRISHLALSLGQMPTAHPPRLLVGIRGVQPCAHLSCVPSCP